MDATVEAIKFLSTPSARRATVDDGLDTLPGFISIHALREEGDHPDQRKGQVRSISIHALREEGDQGVSDGLLVRRISIHALREEGDNHRTTRFDHRSEFLSTPSARRATPPPIKTAITSRFLSTPSARRAT